jgi:hypothetical protein
MKDVQVHELPTQATILDPLKTQYHKKGSFFSYKPLLMKTIKKISTVYYDEPTVNIKLLVDKLIKTVLSTSIAHRNLIINQVPCSVQLPINEDKLALVIGNVINTIISLTHNDHLHICSFQRSEITLRVENTDLSRNRSFTSFLESTSAIAERLDILLKIEGYYGKGSDVSLRFLNRAA